MATLKQLVDETTNIKNEFKTCYTNLKNNLTLKGVNVSSFDKISDLIDKVGSIELGKKWASGTYGDITTIKSTSTQTLNIPISLNFNPTRIIIQIDSMTNNGYVTANKFSIDSFYVNSSSAYAYFPTSVNYNIKLYITNITQNSFNLKYQSSSSSYSWKISNVRWIAIE